MTEQFDYIVVGAGSAGCVVAHRLSADPTRRVLLLEAGPSDASLLVQVPAAYAYAMGSEKYDWRYQSEIEPGIDNRRMTYPRGKGMGGSSSINAMCFTRGHPLDFDRWAENGLPEWSYAHCLPYFKKMETWSRGEDAYRGGGGPLQVTAPEYSSALYEVFLEASRQAGHPHSPDTNGMRQEGFGRGDQTIHQGRRMSTARAYLDPIRQRRNLTIRTECETNRLLFEGRRVTGVEYVRFGQAHIARAQAEVIVCAGALNTPKLLMLSGIGDAAELKKHGIGVLNHLPAVGKYMQDHMDFYIQTICTQPVTHTPVLKLHRKALTGLRWLFSRRGAAATNHLEVVGFMRTEKSLPQPDLGLWFFPLIVASDGSPTGHPHGYQLMGMQLQPVSRGVVSLGSKDPRAAPVIVSNFFKEPEDLAVLREGVKRGRHILAQPAFEAYRGAEVSPGVEVQTDEQIDTFLRRTAKSTRHPSCTCRMGMDEEISVVDAEGRVHGIERLRIIDASVMPNIPSAALNAPTIMLAEKLADCVVGNPPLEPMLTEAAAARSSLPS